VPGIAVRFQTEAPFAFDDGTTDRTVLTDAAGIARTAVVLPAQPDFGSVRATSSAIENFEVNFSVSALAELTLDARSFDVASDASPVALAAVAVDGDGLELVAVGSSAGGGRMIVVDGIPNDPRALPVSGDAGTSPVAAAAFGSRIAIANARIAARENAEVRLFRFDAGQIVLDSARVLTTSNAIGLASFNPTSGGEALAVASAGRSTDPQTCALNQCVCPPGELCLEDGVCVAHDGIIAVLDEGLIEEQVCARPNPACGASCCDDFGIDCEADECGCQVPQRARLGSYRSPLDPRAIIATELRGPQFSELLAISAAGLHLLSQLGAAFRDDGVFVLTPNALGAATANFDVLRDGYQDLLWIESGPCSRGMSIEMLCPTIGTPSAGCLGLIPTDQGGAIPDRDLSGLDGCRRIELPFVPGAICLAQLDGDTRPDVVVSSPTERKLYVFPGDGNGGLLDPPQSLAVAGGPIACADFDGDGRDEVVVADEALRGRFYVVRAR
jgi:hypothetical protein